MRKLILFLIALALWIGANAQTPGHHVTRSGQYKLAGYGFGAGGAGLFILANHKVNTTDPGQINAYKILRAFSVGCMAAGLTFEITSTVHLLKARKLLLTPTGTGLNLTYRF